MEIIKASEFGLKEEKTIAIQEAFSPVIAEKEALTKLYEPFLTAEITPELCKEAGLLRKKLVKVRTGTAKIHKVEKAFFLAAGKFVDAWKNKNTIAVQLMEEKLSEIENFYINIEKEKQAAKQIERAEILDIYDIEEIPKNLGTMTDSAWYFYEKGIKEDFKQKEAAAKKAEKERIAAENAEKERVLGIEKENKRLQKEAKEKEKLANIELEKGRQEKKQLEKELANKKAKEVKEAAEKEAEKQALLQRGDVEKYKDLVKELESISGKYSFESQRFVSMFNGVQKGLNEILSKITK